LSSEDSKHIKNLSDALLKYVSSSQKLVEKISSKAKTVSNIDQIVQHELDVLVDYLTERKKATAQRVRHNLVA